MCGFAAKGIGELLFVDEEWQRYSQGAFSSQRDVRDIRSFAALANSPQTQQYGTDRGYA